MASAGKPGQFSKIPSVNYHLWQACNMRCRFCFATFQGVRKNVLPAGHLDREEALLIVKLLAYEGFLKINFAGGEPFLCPWLRDLVVYAKELGMVTSVVTNGSYFDREATTDLLEHLDWLVLSVDSLNPATLVRLGRVAAHQPMSMQRYLDICNSVTNAGVRLKINTVVTSLNYDEDFTEFIRRSSPRRWKIMQMLPLNGPDSRRAEDLIVSGRNFRHFVLKNRRVKKYGVAVVPETNKDMVGSYVMIDPAGRFYDNVSGHYRYSQSILTEGVQKAISQVVFSRRKFFVRRGWDYFWARWSLPRRIAGRVLLWTLISQALISTITRLPRPASVEPEQVHETTLVQLDIVAPEEQGAAGAVSA